MHHQLTTAARPENTPEDVRDPQPRVGAQVGLLRSGELKRAAKRAAWEQGAAVAGMFVCGRGRLRTIARACSAICPGMLHGSDFPPSPGGGANTAVGGAQSSSRWWCCLVLGWAITRGTGRALGTGAVAACGPGGGGTAGFLIRLAMLATTVARRAGAWRACKARTLARGRSVHRGDPRPGGAADPREPVRRHEGC